MIYTFTVPRVNLSFIRKLSPSILHELLFLASNPTKKTVKAFTRNSSAPLQTDKEVYLYVLELNKILYAAKFVEEKLPHSMLKENITYEYRHYKTTEGEQTTGLVEVFNKYDITTLLNYNIPATPLVTLEGVSLEEANTLLCIVYCIPTVYDSFMASDLLKEAKEYRRTQVFNTQKN